MEKIILIIFIILVFCVISLCVNTWQLKHFDEWYMKKYGKNEYWDIFIKHYAEYKPISYSELGISFSWNDRYDIIVWKKENRYETSVHVHNKDGDCVLSAFNKEKSEKLAKLLMEKWHNVFVKYNLA